MSVFKRQGGWAAKFQLDCKQYWVPGGPWQTQREAFKAEQAYRDTLERRASDETCASFAERWVKEWPRSASATRRNYEAAATRFAADFGSTKLGDVEHIEARAWALKVPRYVSEVVGAMYADARSVGLVKFNPFSELNLPKTESDEEIVPPTLEEYRELLNACTVLGGYAQEFRALIQFTAWTGLRAGEVIGLQWPDIDAETITVQRARKADGKYGKLKNKQRRKIAFLEPARVLDQVPKRHGSPFVFHSPQGRPLSRSTLSHAWLKVRSAPSLERAHQGLPPIRFHDLRHFCATQLLELGMDHFAVSIQLGHKDKGALVMKLYGHPSEDAARARLLALFAKPNADSVARAVARGPHA